MNADGSMDKADWEKLRRDVARMNKRRPKPSERLHKKLLECGIAVEKPERLRPGHWQRSSGAWAWQAAYDRNIVGHNGWIGSQETMAKCAAMTNEELVDEINSYKASC